ncbi:MAG TPA: hypothetical protein VKD89_00375 [Candidatus Udaeobacter sp.]|nr:hypothetical protein [Candidatus Udaeobacter sp.]
MRKEQSSASPVADPEQLAVLLDKARQLVGQYIDSLEERPVFPSEKSVRAMDALVEPLPESPSDPFLVLDQLQEIGAPAVVTQTGGRYFGFVNGGILPVGLAARWIADGWDQNTAHYVMSPINSRLEEICERWIISLLGFPEETAAGFVSGTTIAISQACVPGVTTCFVDAAGTLPARVFMVRRRFVLSPAPKRMRRSTNRFRCSDSDPKTSSLFPWTIRDACELIKCRNWTKRR